MFDLFFVVDLIVNLILDVLLGKGKPFTWFRKFLAGLLLAAGHIAFLLVLVFGIREKAAVWIVIGVIGMLVFLTIDFRYSIWWIQEGRFGAEPPWMANRRHSEPGFVPAPPEEVQICSETENVWEQLNVRKKDR